MINYIFKLNMLKIQCEIQMHFMHKCIYFISASLHTQISYVQLATYVMWDFNWYFAFSEVLFHTKFGAL